MNDYQGKKRTTPSKMKKKPRRKTYKNIRTATGTHTIRIVKKQKKNSVLTIIIVMFGIFIAYTYE